MILWDQSEFGLYEIHRELSATVEKENLPLKLIPILGSVADEAFVSQIFNRYEVDTVFHAAAYKHVSLVENNVIQGLKNNALGTFYCAQAAVSCGVKKFILVSTDKAVRTTSVMGASKRICRTGSVGIAGGLTPQPVSRWYVLVMSWVPPVRLCLYLLSRSMQADR